MSESGSNRLLAALPRIERECLEPMLTRLALQPGATLLVPGDRIERIVFPASGIIAVTVEFSDGTKAAVALLGRESMLGLAALLGMDTFPMRASVLVAGEAWSISADALRAVAGRSVALGDLMRRHAMATLAQVGHHAACAAQHPVRQRTARWLLELQDRTGPGFALTQDALADLVGARRPTVNQVLGRLRQEELIRLVRGAVAVADAEGLEAVACPCRRAIRELRLALLPTSFA